MHQYTSEAKGESLNGTISCGSISGYTLSAGKEFTLEETLDILDGINSEIVKNGFQAIPCIVHEGVLIGRAATKNYRERIFRLDFSWSSRLKPMKRTTFYNTLVEYATRIGNEMKQIRVYLDFDGQTEVLKKR